jgi:thioredoxin 1
MATFKELVNSHPVVLVDFYAEWCGPCKMMTPILEHLKNQMGDKVKIIKIDVDKNPELASQYQIQGVPTFYIFKNGMPVWKKAGAIPGNELARTLNQWIA